MMWFSLLGTIHHLIWSLKSYQVLKIIILIFKLEKPSIREAKPFAEDNQLVGVRARTRT